MEKKSTLQQSIRGIFLILFSLAALNANAEGGLKINSALDMIEEIESEKMSVYNLVASGSKRADRESDLRASIAFNTAKLESITFSASTSSIYNKTLFVTPFSGFSGEQLYSLTFNFGGATVFSAEIGENLGMAAGTKLDAELFYTVRVSRESPSSYILHLTHLEVCPTGSEEKRRIDIGADVTYQHTPAIPLEFGVTEKTGPEERVVQEKDTKINHEPGQALSKTPEFPYDDSDVKIQWSSILLVFPGIVSMHTDGHGNTYWTAGYEIRAFWPKFFTGLKIEGNPAVMVDLGILLFDIMLIAEDERPVEPIAITDGLGDAFNMTLTAQAGLHYDFSPNFCALAFAECGIVHSSFGIGAGGGFQLNHIFDSSSVVGLGIELTYSCLWTPRDSILHRFSLGTHLVF